MKQLTKKFAFATTLGLLTLAFVAPQTAEARWGRRGHHGFKHGKRGKHRGKRLEKMAQKLGLDDATKASIKQLFVQSRAQAKVIRQRLRAERKTMRTLMRQQNPNEATLLAQAKKMHDMRFQLKTLRIKTKVQMLQLLTPDQRTKLQQLRAQRRAKRKARRKAFREKMMKRWQNAK